MKKDGWSFVKELFQCNIGHIVTRETLYEYGKEYSTASVQTLNKYRSHLQSAGYIAQHKQGVYYTVKKIPDGLTVTQCLAEAHTIEHGTY
jgi:hypothetical protein